MFFRDLRHELVDGNRVLVLPRALGIDLRPGQPGIRADVRLADAVRMVQAAEHREILAMLGQRLQRRRQIEIPA